MDCKILMYGCLGGSVGWASDFGSGLDLVVRGFKPHVELCADSSEPGACFGFCVSLSLCSSPTHVLSLSLSLSKINIKKIKNIYINRNYELSEWVSWQTKNSWKVTSWFTGYIRRNYLGWHRKNKHNTHRKMKTEETYQEGLTCVT